MLPYCKNQTSEPLGAPAHQYDPIKTSWSWQAHCIVGGARLRRQGLRRRAWRHRRRHWPWSNKILYFFLYRQHVGPDRSAVRQEVRAVVRRRRQVFRKRWSCSGRSPLPLTTYFLLIQGLLSLLCLKLYR